MATCLVTTLRENVSDPSLLKLGQLKIKVYNDSNNPPFLFFQYLPVGETFHIDVMSPGYITDETGTQNLGTSIDLFRGSQAGCYLIPGEYDVIIDNKYKLSNFFTRGDSVAGSGVTRNLGLNLKDLMGAEIFDGIAISATHIEGTLDDLKNLPALTSIRIPSDGANKLTGNISSLSGLTNLTELRLPNNSITGDISSLSGLTNLTTVAMDESPLSGDISSLAGLQLTVLALTSRDIIGTTSTLGNMTSLNQLKMKGVSLSGNLASLASLTNLTSLDIRETQVVGDTSSLANLTNLVTFLYAGTAITGTWPLV